MKTLSCSQANITMLTTTRAVTQSYMSGSGVL